MIQLLRGYKWAISPLFPPSCRYVPTCSEYAMEAVDRYGAFRGTAMALWRLLRCHPFAKGGYDPVVTPAPPVSAIHISTQCCHSERSEESAFLPSVSACLHGEEKLSGHQTLTPDAMVH